MPHTDRNWAAEIATTRAAVQALQQVEAAMTPGPWEWQHYYNFAWLGPVGCHYAEAALDDGSACGEYSACLDHDSPDGTGIATARNLFPAVLADWMQHLDAHEKAEAAQTFSLESKGKAEALTGQRWPVPPGTEALEVLRARTLAIAAICGKGETHAAV